MSNLRGLNDSERELVESIILLAMNDRAILKDPKRAVRNAYKEHRKNILSEMDSDFRHFEKMIIKEIEERRAPVQPTHIRHHLPHDGFPLGDPRYREDGKYASLTQRVADRYMKVAKSPRKKWENPNNGRSKVVYVEAILDNPKQLLNWWEKNVKDYMGAGDPVPLLDTKVAHHMTIAYGGNNPGIPLAEVEQMGIGGKVQLEVIGYDYSDKVQAVLVKPKGVKSSNRYPHITVAVGNGGKPADSNDLLARRNIKDVPSKLTLSATIGYFGRGKHHTQIDWENE